MSKYSINDSFSVNVHNLERFANWQDGADLQPSVLGLSLQANDLCACVILVTLNKYANVMLIILCRNLRSIGT